MLLRTDGIYVATTEGSFSCLRFYVDKEKTDLRVSLQPNSMKEGVNVDEILGWFDKEGAAIDDCSQGDYCHHRRKLSFETRSRMGEILHSGTISETGLSLRVESRITGNASYLDYQLQKRGLSLNVEMQWSHIKEGDST
jgi:hypothetical protein